MKYYIIAGEKSGDQHAGNLIKKISLIDNRAQFRGVGGDYMQTNGCTLDIHMKSIAFMGFLEVLKNYNVIRKALRDTRKNIRQFEPDALILVDYAGFNLRIAKSIKNLDTKVIYYISPKIWAWNTGRAKQIKKRVDKMYCILPFEEDFYRDFNFEAEYVGNPVMDSVQDFSISSKKVSYKPDKEYKKVVALLPGSRYQEVTKIRTLFLKVIESHSDIFFLIAGVSNLNSELYNEYELPNSKVVFDDTYNLLCSSDAAIVTSGTATLETALLEVPQLVVYKSSAVSIAIARMVVKIKFISLVNLILGRESVKELIQSSASSETVNSELYEILYNEEKITKIKSDYNELQKLLGDKNAAENTAKKITQYLDVSK